MFILLSQPKCNKYNAMRKTKIAFILVFAIIQGSLSTVAKATDQNQTIGEPIDLKTGQGRPRSIVIPPYCYFSNGYLYIRGEKDITSIKTEVIRLDDNVKWNGSGSDCTQILYISEELGDYIIKVIFSDGMTYYGQYTH